MIHLIGAGHVAEKIIKDTPEETYFIYDNNQDLHGSYLRDILIRPVDELLKNEQGEILICTTSVTEVKAQLIHLGVDLPIKVPSILEEFLVQSEIIEARQSFLIASGLPSNNLHGASGGLFKITENEGPLAVEELISGSCHGMVRDEGRIVVSAQEEGLVILDEDLERVSTITLPEGARPHGIAATEKAFYVVASNLDAILEVNKDGSGYREIPFSRKRAAHGSAQHHANDIEIIGNVAYVSMFSVSGAWKHGLFDGGLLEIDLETKEVERISLPVKLPHSVRSVDGDLVILNSFESKLYGFGKFEEYQFNGFLRGLDFDRDYLYIAESRNRNSTGLKRTIYPISVDSKINIVSRKEHYSRSISLPSNISEIHSVLVL
jgi:hypothetical protein